MLRSSFLPDVLALQATDWRRKIDILQMERHRTRQLLRSLTGMTGAPNTGAQSAALSASNSIRAAL